MAKKINKKETPKEPKKEFLVTITFNNQTHTFETNSVEESILSVKPFHLKTKIIVKIEKNGQAVEKFLPGTKGKLLFMNPSYLAAFVRGFFFK